MSSNRVQKLLFSEYCDFEDMVLIESPFAQTTKDGKGIRQVHLGLTPSKLVLATDVLPPVEYVNVKYIPGIDPEIETFELIAIYPVECVNLSIYRKKQKQALKARFCNNKVLYFELGGFEKRAMFWNLWCEKVKFFCPGESGSSKSETSVATSSTGSTLYLLDKKIISINGIKQLWCKFGSSTIFGSGELSDQKDGTLVRKWTDKHIYLGKDFDISWSYQQNSDYSEEQDCTDQNKNKRIVIKPKFHQSYMEEKGLNFGDSVKFVQMIQGSFLRSQTVALFIESHRTKTTSKMFEIESFRNQINRFGSGVNEGCSNPLYLPVDDYIIPRRMSQMLHESTIQCASSENYDLNYYQLAETAVLVWEFYKADNPNKYKMRHRRRYGLGTQPMLLYGFDPNINACGIKYSTIMKRAVSEVVINKHFADTEFVLPINRHLLKKSISHQNIHSERKPKNNPIMNVAKSPLIIFWTPGYQYFPKSARVSFETFHNQLMKLKEFQDINKKRKKRKRKRNIFRKMDIHKKNYEESDDGSLGEPIFKKVKKKKHGFIYNIFNKNHVISELETNKKKNESSFHCFKRMLHADIVLSSWDIDSTTLAENLTMIDKELFLKVSTNELECLFWDHSSENAANLIALISFSHRISSLIAYEILKNETERSRARLVARFVNTANKCHRIANFQSCKTILNGLQTPAVYRLRKTWAYVRKKHASKYETFEILCRLYKDPRLHAYQKTFFILSQNPPFLPHIGDVISRLLGKVPGYDLIKLNKNLAKLPSIETTKSSAVRLKFHEDRSGKLPDIFNKIYRIFVGGGDVSAPTTLNVSQGKETSLRRRSVKFKTLSDYYSNTDLYNVNSIRKLDETTKFLEKCQLGALDYNFRINNNVREYLLKSRYTNDKQNFYYSFSVESAFKFYE